MIAMPHESEEITSPLARPGLDTPVRASQYQGPDKRPWGAEFVLVGGVHDIKPYDLRGTWFASTCSTCDPHTVPHHKQCLDTTRRTLRRFISFFPS